MTKVKHMHDFDISHVRRAAALLQGRVVRTPLLESPMLSQRAGCRLLLKAESLQRTGSFKYRGALHMISSLDEAARRRGVVTFSAGNHGHAVAAAAREAGTTAVIILPDTAASIKVENCRWWGAEIVMYDPHKQNREDIARELVSQRQLTFIPPFDHVDIMAGQGTCAIEICEQLADLAVRPDAVVINCSGGGLSSGVTEVMRHMFPETAVFLVEPSGYEKMARSLRSGVPERLAEPPRTLLDGIGGPVAGLMPLQVLKRHAVTGLSVTDDEALVAMEQAFRFLKLVIEPGGAASLAAVLAQKADFTGKNVVVIASGGNVDGAVFVKALQREA